MAMARRSGNAPVNRIHVSLSPVRLPGQRLMLDSRDLASRAVDSCAPHTLPRDGFECPTIVFQNRFFSDVLLRAPHNAIAYLIDLNQARFPAEVHIRSALTLNRQTGLPRCRTLAAVERAVRPVRPVLLWVDSVRGRF